MLEWAHDPEVTRYMVMGVIPNTIDALEHEYDEMNSGRTAALTQTGRVPSDIVFAIVHQEDDVHIGNVGIFGIDWVSRVAEVRVILGDRRFWGRGYSIEAYRLTVEYAFDRLNLRRLTAGSRADNAPSIAALERLGFVEEGRLREALLRDEVAYDVVTFGLLRREYTGVQPKDA
jgi:RimJ/RimL family protein N-acetyltransferase